VVNLRLTKRASGKLPARDFKAAPRILFDSVEAKKVGLTWLIISAVAFVGSIIVNAVFLRKKRLA
jgi:hypothetical protein